MRRGFIAFLCTFFLRTFSQTQQNLPQAKNWAGFTSDYGGTRLTAAENNEPGPGHIYYSMNGGESWQKSDAPDVSYYDIAGSSNGQFVIASGATSKTLYISRTEGKNWTIPITPRSNPISVALSSNGQYMAYTRNENEAACITMSQDYGVTWTTVGPTGVCGVLGISSSSNGTFIVVAVSGEGLYHSGDAGKTFTLQFPTQNIVFSKIVYAYQSVSIWYASMTTVPWQIITSLDNGLHWAPLNGTAQNSMVPITYLTVDASGANLLSVWGGDLYSSTNFGGFFRQINSFPSTSERCTLNGDGVFCLYNYGNSSWEYTNVYSADPSEFFILFFVFLKGLIILLSIFRVRRISQLHAYTVSSVLSRGLHLYPKSCSQFQTNSGTHRGDMFPVRLSNDLSEWLSCSVQMVSGRIGLSGQLRQ
jgi:photosystem II stability/assembly factor-like uncharacterized protein